MNLNKTYQSISNNLLFSNSGEVNNERKKVLNKFNAEYFNRKKNESLQNLDYDKLIHLNYNYYAGYSLTKKNQDNSYSINIVNGKCENYNDDKIELSNIDTNFHEYFFNNKLSLTNDFIIDLNSLFMNSGFKIIIKKNKKVEINISNILSNKDLTVFQKNLIVCEKGSQLTLTEDYEGQELSINNVFNVIEIDDKAKFKYFIIQDNINNHDLHLSSFATCKTNSSYEQNVFNFSEGYVRNYHFADLIDKNSKVSLKGIFFLNKKNSADNKTFVNHKEESCISNQVYKGILNDYAKASYISNTYVDKKAQLTEGFQLSKGILLSENSSFFSKPELRIFADNVKCTHGSTIGPIDENAIFYLRSRGLNQIDSLKILIKSLINEDLENLKNVNVINIVEKKLIKYLSKVK